MDDGPLLFGKLVEILFEIAVLNTAMAASVLFNKDVCVCVQIWSNDALIRGV